MAVKKSTDDEKALTVPMVFGKVELSAKKADVWTVGAVTATLAPVAATQSPVASIALCLPFMET